MVGKFTSPRKNHIPLIKAVERLADTHDVQLTLIGELEEPDHDYFARIQRKIANSDIKDAINIRANLRYDAVQQAYLEHDIYVLPSARERAAVSHLEAMAHGLPVICSATNGTSCYVNPGENGYLITPGDREELQAQIERLLVNNRLREFGKNSYELVETTYSGEQFYEKLRTILQENF
jgi:glycosyltransferase involved in cell wall biosynthesis